MGKDGGRKINTKSSENLSERERGGGGFKKRRKEQEKNMGKIENIK